MAAKIKFNSKAFEEILKVRMRKPIDELAHRIAANVDVGSVTEAQIYVNSFETDRAGASIVIGHPAGIAIEAKHGALRKAAASQGFEVSAPKHSKT